MGGHSQNWIRSVPPIGINERDKFLLPTAKTCVEDEILIASCDIVTEIRDCFLTVCDEDFYYLDCECTHSDGLYPAFFDISDVPEDLNDIFVSPKANLGNQNVLTLDQNGNLDLKKVTLEVHYICNTTFRNTIKNATEFILLSTY